MGMYHSTSGKAGFERFKYPARVTFTREQAIAILRREDELRFDAKTQERYSEREDFVWIRDVTLDLQRQAITETVPELLKFHDSMNDCLNALHNLRFDDAYAGDNEFSQCTVYQRCDKSHPGTVKQGDALTKVDVPLHDSASGKAVHLSDYYTSGRPLVVVAGSVS